MVNHYMILGCWVLGETRMDLLLFESPEPCIPWQHHLLTTHSRGFGRHGAGKAICHKELGTRLDEIVPRLFKVEELDC